MIKIKTSTFAFMLLFILLGMFGAQKVYATENLENLAEGKVAVASSTYSNEYPASKLTDGNESEGWIANPSEKSSWVYVDLGSQKSINNVKIYWGQYDFAKSYKVEVSNDKTTWVEKYSTTEGKGGIDDINFSNTEASFVRVSCTAKSDIGNWSYEIYELKVFNSVIVPPDTPTGLKPDGTTESTASLSWNTSSNATGYKLYRGTSEIYSGQATSFTDTGLLENTEYKYTVSAFNSAGESPHSESISVFPNPVHPDTPTDLKCVGTTESTATLSWNTSSNATGYKLYRGTSEIYSGQATSFTDTGLIENTEYRYTVSAFNSAGESPHSEAISVIINPTVHKHNHAYLNSEWFNSDYPLTDAQIAAKVNDLKKYYIEYQFCDIGRWEKASDIETHLTASDYGDLGHWIKVSRETDPNQKIIATINADVQAGYFVDINGKELPFGTTVRNEVKILCDTLVNKGVLYKGVYYKVDGIQVDFEPFEPQCQLYYKNILTDIRTIIGTNKHLSSATPVANWKDDDYAISIINLLDMVNPMIYDTNGPTSWGDYSDGVTQNEAEFTRLVKETTIKYSNWISKSNNKDCQLSPITPVYNDRCTRDKIYYHKSSIENIKNSITGIKQAINEGANVYSSGIFWWSFFVGESKEYPNYATDQDAWMNSWVLNH